VSQNPRSTSPGLSADDRFELALEASRAERRNRPRSMVYLALLVLLLCATFALFSWRGAASAEREMQLQEARLQDVSEKLERLGALELVESVSDGGGSVDPQEVLSTFVDIASEAGLEDKLPSINFIRQEGTDGTMYEWRWTKRERVSDPDLGAVLRWIVESVERIEGLEVTQLLVKPQARQGKWDVDVAFRRWEPNR